MFQTDQRQSQAIEVRQHPSRMIAFVFGVVYVALGVLGFLVTGFDNFASDTNESLLGFQVNPLHNLVHLAVGLLGIVMARRTDSARTYGWLLVAMFGATFVYGLFAAGNRDVNFLNINSADNVLHFLNVLIGFAIALWPRDRGSAHV